MRTRSMQMAHPTLGEARPSALSTCVTRYRCWGWVVVLSRRSRVLRVECGRIRLVRVTAAVVGVPRGQLALAIALTVMNYAVLTLYDQLAFRYIGNAFRARESR